MDSNSSSPFMGLELSVDAREPQSQNNLQRAAGNDLTVTPVLLTSHNRDVRAPFQQHLSSDELTYALPTVDLGKSPRHAAEVEDIMHRITGS